MPEPVIKIEHETGKAPAGNTLVKHPDNITAGSSWSRVTVTMLASGQPRPYADGSYIAEIAIEGGCGSTKTGFDLPFGVGRDERFVKELARTLVRHFSDEPGPFGTRLTSCEKIHKTDTYAVWRVCIVEPSTD